MTPLVTRYLGWLAIQAVLTCLFPTAMLVLSFGGFTVISLGLIFGFRQLPNPARELLFTMNAGILLHFSTVGMLINQPLNPFILISAGVIGYMQWHVCKHIRTYEAAARAAVTTPEGGPGDTPAL